MQSPKLAHVWNESIRIHYARMDSDELGEKASNTRRSVSPTSQLEIDKRVRFVSDSNGVYLSNVHKRRSSARVSYKRKMRIRNQNRVHNIEITIKVTSILACLALNLSTANHQLTKDYWNHFLHCFSTWHVVRFRARLWYTKTCKRM